MAPQDFFNINYSAPILHSTNKAIVSIHFFNRLSTRSNMGIFTLALSIIILVLGLCTMLESSPLSLTTDKEALISFKFSVLVGPERPNPLSTWEQNLSPCNWSGVSCNKLGHRVTGLKLSGLGMAGSISPYIGNLSFLRSLELQNNQLTGKLPDQLGNLFRLRNLNVSFNRFEGVIPSNLSQCRELRVIDLTQNQISGTIPEDLSNLMQLQVLNLAANQLSGDLPSSLANISSLGYLRLGTNRLSGPIPGDLSRLVNLKVLDLTVNNLSGTVPPSLYNSSSLVYLALASNNLWGDLPGDVGLTLPNLLGFNFCINKFTGTIPWSLQNLTNIQIIRMAHNRLHGTIPPGLGNLPKLKMYNIGFNNIVNSNKDGLGFLELLSNSTQLDFLAFDSNLLEGVIPTSIGNLSKVLTKLYMGGNNIYGTIPSSIGDLAGLELLSLMNNSVSGEIPQVIGQLKELRVLTLADNRLSGGIPDSLGNLQLLTEIDLSKNQLIGNIPITFGNLQNLISMDLSYNELNGNIPKEIVSLSKLSIFLNLSDNQLTGTLPEQIGFLENIREIIFSENKMYGNIPKSIMNCKSLEKLVLARNMLSGPIPGSLGDVKGLVTLDLSSNQLSDEIPFELQKLLSLQLLNLSFNNLEGQVPTGGIFADPSKVRLELEGNRNLCSDLSCRISRGRGRRLTTVYIITSIAIAISLCFALMLLYFFRKGKGMTIEGSFKSLNGQHDMISYCKLRNSTDDFDQENLIGRGSFGCVYKGILEGAVVAVKVLDSAMARSRKCFLAECAALKHLRHRNLIKLLTICSSIDNNNEEFLALVFQFMSNGSLDDWIRGKRRHANGAGLSALERLKTAIGVASAIDYMHNETEVPIVHCDLKPSNVLMDSDMTPKVADFGLAKLLLRENQSSLSFTHTLKGSIGYIPPEYGYGEKPSTAGDVYSFGILLLELFTGKSPTDEIFTGGLTLKSWVRSEFPTQVEKDLDANFLEEKIDIWEDDEGEYSSKLKKRNCMAILFGVGLSCTADAPDIRIGIRDALCKLKSVEKILLQDGIIWG